MTSAGRPRTLAGALALLLGTAGPAAAEPAPAPAGPPAEHFGHTAPVLPSLQVAGSPSGAATFKAGADLVYGLSDAWDLDLAPQLSVSTQNGLGQLVSFDQAKQQVTAPSDWSLGLSVGATWLHREAPDQRPEQPDTVAKGKAVAAKAYALCLAKCAACQSVPEVDQPFCKARAKETDADRIAPGDLDPGEFCPEGQELFKKEDKRLAELFGKRERDLRALFPALDLSVGAQVGPKSFQYLAPQPNDPSTYHVTSSTEAAYAVAGALTWTSDDLAYAKTIEVPIAVQHKPSGSTKTGHWCVPKGKVARTDQAGAATDPLESCTDKPLGGPTASTAVSAAVLVGAIPKPDGHWRLSMGPRLSYDSSAESLGLGFEVPVYWSFASLSNDYTGEYKGVLRLNPGFLLVHTTSGWDEQATVTIEVLGKRSMFLRALDWL